MGTRQTQNAEKRKAEDHPHACGDKGFSCFQRVFNTGSSPRVWGQEPGLGLRALLSRIIPTRVGTRSDWSFGFSSAMDHPHACGDKAILIPEKRNCAGSSPRVWGQDTCACDRSFFARIIPTRVGTSRHLYIRDSQTEDHPHACGDKFAALELVYDVLKSSPRVWGQVELPMGAANAARIIPTCVGTRMFYMRLMQKK